MDQGVMGKGLRSADHCWQAAQSATRFLFLPKEAAVHPQGLDPFCRRVCNMVIPPTPKVPVASDTTGSIADWPLIIRPGAAAVIPLGEALSNDDDLHSRLLWPGGQFHRENSHPALYQGFR